MNEFEKLTPQVAKLIVLKLNLASANKLREIVDDDSISPSDKPALRAAIENNIEEIQGRINYQSKICGSVVV